MITTQKLFGSYVLQNPNDLFQENEHEYDSEERISSCTLPPVWIELELLAKREYNHDTSLFRFKLPNNIPKLNLPFGSFLLIKAPRCGPNGEDAIRPYTSVSDNSLDEGSFEILVKRYHQWGVKESSTTNFLFTKTNHSYRPPGIASNFIHGLNPGDKLQFKHTRLCLGRVAPSLSSAPTVVRTLTMVAVGAGIAPMIQMLRHILQPHPLPPSPPAHSGSSSSPHLPNLSECLPSELDQISPPSFPPPPDSSTSGFVSSTYSNITELERILQRIERVVLLYGVRQVKDILMRELLESWETSHPGRFKVVFCVGSRWANVHMGAKSLLKGRDQGDSTEDRHSRPTEQSTEYSVSENSSRDLDFRGDRSGIWFDSPRQPNPTRGKSSEYIPPPLPEGFSSLRHAEVGWVNEDSLRLHAFPPSTDTKVLVCGLPGVYDKLCGSRFTPSVDPNSALGKLGYQDSMVIKL